MPDFAISEQDLTAYTGRWVALISGQVVGQGGTPEQARQAAAATRFKERPLIQFIPTPNELNFSPLLDRVRAALPARSRVYLVGGAVRDALLGQASHDLDFAVPKDALRMARKVAKALEGAYYRMDDEHETGRVILTSADDSRQTLDFSAFQGADLEADLRARDFTVNAMAVHLDNPQELLDPLGGLLDLRAKRLRACSASAMSDDPVRVLRAIRLASTFRLNIEPETRSQMKAAVGRIPQSSIERLRDELFRILEAPKPATSIRALDVLGALPHVLPELADLKGVTQSAPHTSDVWEHTLSSVQHLEEILTVLDEVYSPEGASDLFTGLVVLRLGRYRGQFAERLKSSLVPERFYRPLLFLAALYHDIAKPQTRTVEEDGRIRFLGHDEHGAPIAAARAAALRLSNAEVERLEAIVRGHMRPHHLANAGELPSRRAVYRFFRDTGEAAVDICLLSIADLLAIYGPTLRQETLAHHLEVLRVLLEAYWEQPEERVSPPPLVNGDDLMREFKLQPGPQIGELLEAVREAQAAGEIKTQGDAYELAERMLQEMRGAQ